MQKNEKKDSGFDAYIEKIISQPPLTYLADRLDTVANILRRDIACKETQAGMAAWRLADVLGALSKHCPEGAAGIDAFTGLGYRLEKAKHDRTDAEVIGQLHRDIVEQLQIELNRQKQIRALLEVELADLRNREQLSVITAGPWGMKPEC